MNIQHQSKLGIPMLLFCNHKRWSVSRNEVVLVMKIWQLVGYFTQDPKVRINDRAERRCTAQKKTTPEKGESKNVEFGGTKWQPV